MGFKFDRKAVERDLHKAVEEDMRAGIEALFRESLRRASAAGFDPTRYRKVVVGRYPDLRLEIHGPDGQELTEQEFGAMEIPKAEAERILAGAAKHGKPRW